MLVCKGFIDIDHRLEYYYIFLISIPPLHCVLSSPRHWEMKKKIKYLRHLELQARTGGSAQRLFKTMQVDISQFPNIPIIV